MPLHKTLVEIFQLSQSKIGQIGRTPAYTSLVAGQWTPSIRRAFYQQDRPYLNGYANAMRIVSGRMSHYSYVKQYDRDALLLKNMANRIDKYEKKLGAIGTQFNPPVRGCIEIMNYMAHLQRTVRHDSLVEAVACLTPCMYIYHRCLGKEMQESKCALNNPDGSLIETFYGPHFIEDALTLELMLNRFIIEYEKTISKEKVQSAFLTSVDCEHQFFKYLSTFLDEPHNTAAFDVIPSRVA